MDFRTFRAANLQEALTQIRSELGPDARVLQTRQVRESVWGFWGKTRVEVTATLQDVGGQGTLGLRKQEIDPIDQPKVLSSTTQTWNPTSDTSDLPSELLQCRQHLLARGVSLDQVNHWLEQVRVSVERSNSIGSSATSWNHELRRIVVESLKLAGEIQVIKGKRLVVALVGPTGVGKTTTIAKIAASFRLKSPMKIGLLTTDTFRVGGVQQIAEYAQMLGVPIEVAKNGSEAAEALSRLSKMDLVLIDTCGRSPRSSSELDDLESILRAVSPDQTHLVLATTGSTASLRLAMNGFSPLNPTHLLLTKLDEVSHPAGVVADLVSSKSSNSLPLGYFTDGQRVPGDLSAATSESIASIILPAFSPVDRYEVA